MTLQMWGWLRAGTLELAQALLLLLEREVRAWPLTTNHVTRAFVTCEDHRLSPASPAVPPSPARPRSLPAPPCLWGLLTHRAPRCPPCLHLPPSPTPPSRHRPCRPFTPSPPHHAPLSPLATPCRLHVGPRQVAPRPAPAPQPPSRRPLPGTRSALVVVGPAARGWLVPGALQVATLQGCKPCWRRWRATVVCAAATPPPSLTWTRALPTCRRRLTRRPREPLGTCRRSVSARRRSGRQWPATGSTGGRRRGRRWCSPRWSTSWTRC